MRTYYIWLLFESSDVTWVSAIAGLWTWAEIGIGILISCLPVFPRFFTHVKPKIYSLHPSQLYSGSSDGKGIKLTNSFTRNKIPSTSKGPSTHESGNISGNFSARRMPNGLSDSNSHLQGEDASLGEHGLIVHAWPEMENPGSDWRATPATRRG